MSAPPTRRNLPADLVAAPHPDAQLQFCDTVCQPVFHRALVPVDVQLNAKVYHVVILARTSWNVWLWWKSNIWR